MTCTDPEVQLLGEVELLHTFFSPNPEVQLLGEVELLKEYPLMVNAIVLINVERGHVNDVAQQLVALDGVTEVFSVAGRYDLVAVLRSPTNERIAELVTHHIVRIQCIANTETLLAFQVFSRYDLEAMFSLGLE